MWHGPALTEALAAFTAAEAAAHPVADAHSAWELVLHLTAWAELAAARLDGGAVAYPQPAVEWPPAPTEGGDEAWAAAQARLAAAYDALAAQVRVLPADRLVERVPGQEHTIAVMLDGVVEHGAYHGGQLALLRRAVAIARASTHAPTREGR